MASVGLVPGEHSSGDKHRRGRITRTGNALVRRWLKPRGTINTGRASGWRSRDDAKVNQAV
jgi:transposase